MTPRQYAIEHQNEFKGSVMSDMMRLFPHVSVTYEQAFNYFELLSKLRDYFSDIPTNHWYNIGRVFFFKTDEQAVLFRLLTSGEE